MMNFLETLLTASLVEILAVIASIVAIYDFVLCRMSRNKPVDGSADDKKTNVLKAESDHPAEVEPPDTDAVS